MGIEAGFKFFHPCPLFARSHHVCEESIETADVVGLDPLYSLE